jgi:hypothetical protein
MAPATGACAQQGWSGHRLDGPPRQRGGLPEISGNDGPAIAGAGDRSPALGEEQEQGLLVDVVGCPRPCQALLGARVWIVVRHDPRPPHQRWNRSRRFRFPSRREVFCLPSVFLRGKVFAFGRILRVAVPPLPRGAASSVVARSPFQSAHIRVLQRELPLRRCLSRGEDGHLNDDPVGECLKDETSPPDMRTRQDADPVPGLEIARSSP